MRDPWPALRRPSRKPPRGSVFTEMSSAAASPAGQRGAAVGPGPETAGFMAGWDETGSQSGPSAAVPCIAPPSRVRLLRRREAARRLDASRPAETGDPTPAPQPKLEPRSGPAGRCKGQGARDGRGAGWEEQGKNAPKVGAHTLAGGAGPRQGRGRAGPCVGGKGAEATTVWRDKCKKLRRF